MSHRLHSVSESVAKQVFVQGRDSFKSRLILLATIASLWSLPRGAIAQNSSGSPLPPPPNVPLVPPSQLPTVDPNGTPATREEIFQVAPVTPVAPVVPMPAKLNQYRVYVNGDSPLLLQTVKRFEPGAFVQSLDGRRVIQVGIFGTEDNARQRMATLAAQGIATQMAVGKSLAPGSASNRRGGYYVVVPGSRSRLPELRDRALQLGVQQNSIQLRDRPLGPHVAIGPFTEVAEAETMERYLREKGNLNTRLYFDH